MIRSIRSSMTAALGLHATPALPADGSVVLGAGMRGDRVSVIFGSLAELGGFVDETC